MKNFLILTSFFIILIFFACLPESQLEHELSTEPELEKRTCDYYAQCQHVSFIRNGSNLSLQITFPEEVEKACPTLLSSPWVLINGTEEIDTYPQSVSFSSGLYTVTSTPFSANQLSSDIICLYNLCPVLLQYLNAACPENCRGCFAIQ